MDDKDKALEERILWLSFRWQTLRDRADFLEGYGHDPGNLRALMFDLQMQIRRLKDEMALEEDRLKILCGEVK